MGAKYRSYRLPKDDLAYLSRQVSLASISVMNSREELSRVKAKVLESERELELAQARLIALLEQQNKKFIVVDSVKYSVVDGRLKKEFVF